MELVQNGNFSFFIEGDLIDIFTIKGRKIGKFLVVIEGNSVTFKSEGEGCFSCPLDTYMDDRAFTLSEAAFQTYLK